MKVSSMSEGAGVPCVPQDGGREHLAPRTAPAQHSHWVAFTSALYEVMGGLARALRQESSELLPAE